ncbi:MAG: transcription termination/antitermination protein NusG [Planctomycetota bacterium]
MAREWYVLRVQAGKEEKVKEALDKKLKVAGLDHLVGEVLVAKKQETTLRDGKKVTKDVKIFPGYIYLQADLYEGQELRDNLYYLIKETPSVGDFAGSFGRPAPMSPDDVDRIFNRDAPKSNLPETADAGVGGSEGGPTPESVLGGGLDGGTPIGDVDLPYSGGDRVRIREGHAFGGFEGRIEEIQFDRGMVKVSVSIFGRPTEVELPYNQVEPLDE